MALTRVNIDPGKTVEATHVNQYYDVLTGAITDQVITLANRMNLGGSQGASDNLLTLRGVTSQTGQMIRVLLASGDAQPAFSLDKNGKLAWGAGGGSATDTTLERIAAAQLGLNGSMRFAEIATPSAPGAGFGTLYFKADGNPYIRSPESAGGVEQALAVGAATLATDPVLVQVWT